jgi:predicted HTH transcriptional regulator|tara:strand:- start:808 stop:1188 length:381 start_codon:yes stop_codon:yes gene_type:complete
MKITTTRLKQISYEDTYAYCILGFERLQARKKGRDGKPLRPPLPCDRGEKRSRTNTSAFTPILKALKKHGPMTSSEISKIMNKSWQSISTTIDNCIKAGLVEKQRHIRKKHKKHGTQNCWLYQIAA